MIKYEAVQNKFLYKTEDIDKIIEIIQNGNYYNVDNCTQEKISILAKSIEDFMSNLKVVPENVILERHETEEEAREYFGIDFITKFDNLLTSLDLQDTIVALHGTFVEFCPNICEEGLRYKFPSISSTAVQQQMNYGQKEIHYENYENLLNWCHKNYKGLVILAIPYECYYKEGIWNHFQETDSSFYGGQDYKIDSDFIVGYIDVNNKQIVLNPRYNRKHNYAGYIKDNELFREQLDMDNSKFKQLIIKSELELSQIKDQPKSIDKEEQFDISKIPYIIDDLIGVFNSIKLGFPNGMTERRYNDFLKQLSYGYMDILKNISLLKTNKQIEQEKNEKYTFFQSKQLKDEDISWDDEYEWEELNLEDKNNNKTL